MRWYKYMEKCFAEEMISSGKIRINSLNYYKDIETHGNGVGDKEENTLSAVSVIEKAKSLDQLNHFEKRFVKVGPEKHQSYISISNCVMKAPHSGRPTYAFCLSDLLSEEFLEQMNIENEKVGNNRYETCVMISDHVALVNLLKNQLKAYGLEYYGHGHCFYKTRNIPWNKWDFERQQCPAFVKETAYTWQREVRVIFETKSHDDLEPIDCLIDGLSTLCSIVKV